MKNLIRKNVLIAGILMTGIFSACSDDDVEIDTESPIISINKPTLPMYVLDTVTNKVDVSFDIAVSDNDELHSVSIEVKNVSDNKTEMIMHFHPDKGNFSFDTTITFSDPHKDQVLTVIAEDHNENETTVSHDFHIHQL